MKSFAQIIVYFIVVFNLISGLQAGLFLVRNGAIYCKWSTRGSCDKTSTYCVNVPTLLTCKLYKNECKFLIDKCLGKTVYGRSGVQGATTDCQNLVVGQSGTC